MGPILLQNAYGKSRVRLTRVTRHADRHDLKEVAIDIQLEGDFAATYLTGDNRQVVATDSMKNTVYVLARNHPVKDIETFGQVLARHFLDTYPQITKTTIHLSEQPWQRIVVDGREHPHAFIGGGSERRTCTVTRTHLKERIESGLDDLLLLKTTDSAFQGFLRDQFTTLPEADDRIFATVLCARWLYHSPQTDWDQCHQTIRQAMLKVFGMNMSYSVQQTLYEMGGAALEECPAIEEISLTMPNQHRLPINLKPFGLDNPNEVFVPTDEPFGLISGTIRRGDCPR